MQTRIALTLSLSTLLLLSGCAAAPVTQPVAVMHGISGKVMGGQSPVSGATIQLYEVGSTTDGGASTALIPTTTVVTTSDGTGLMNSNANAGNAYNTLPRGSFNITGDYTCPPSDPLVYFTGSGGNPGSGVNPDLQILAALGQCSTLSSSTNILANEVTTVGSIAALYPYMTAYNAIGATPTHATALAAAFDTAAAYMNFSTGTAPGPALAAGYTASDSDVRTLANSVAACINSSGGTANDGSVCGSLLYLSKPNSQTAAATDTVGALIDIFNNPSNNTAAIFGLGSATPPFAPSDTYPPADWSAPILPTPGTPVLSSAGGSFTTSQPVTLSDSDATAVLYYTLDGSVPSASSTRYTGTITISTTETLKAIAIESGRLASSVASASFTLSGYTMPTVSLSPSFYSTAYGSTNTIVLTATSPVNGSVVTFGTAGPVGGSFSAPTCAIASGSCIVSYYPSGTLSAGSYPGALIASFSASGSYGPASASSTLVIESFSFSILASFTGASGAIPGSEPNFAALVQGRDGYFYGTTQVGGSSNDGTVFKIASDGSNYQVLHNFTSAAISGTSKIDGSQPYAGLVQGTDGFFYGTTTSGGTNGYGTVFKISSDGSGYTQLHAFTEAAISGTSQTDGGFPYAGVVQGSDGYFYGTTLNGGSTDYGTVFKISSDGSTYTVLHSFTGTTIANTSQTDGLNPWAGMMQGSDGYFYGTTYSGGASSNGTVYKISADGGSYTQLYAFTNASIAGTSLTDGAGPAGTLVQGSDGYFYGTTSLGAGYNSYGAFFKVPSNGGTYSELHAFSQLDGVNSVSGLVLGSDGYFYGTAQGCGYSGGVCRSQSSDGGTAYKISSTGTETQLHYFSGGPISGTSQTDGDIPVAGLIQGSDGFFYGTTALGGAGSVGTLYKVTESPALASPISLSVPSSVTHATTYTVSYAVSNAYSDTLKNCEYFTVNAAGTVVSSGPLTASPTAANATLTAPSATGTYSLALTCGGQETGFATLNVQ